MNLIRIVAILKRLLRIAKRDTHRLIDLIYWPTQDMLIWGFTGYWIQKEQFTDIKLNFILLSGLILWTFMVQISKEIPWTLLDEFWSHNFANLFASPLKLYEWNIAVMIIGVIKALVVFSYAIILVWLVYNINILSLSILLLPALFSLIIFGWTLGFLTSSFLIYWGQKIQVLTWVMGWVFAPFCGIFYPIEVLPPWAQNISSLLPPSYIFQATRKFINNGISDFILIIKGLLLAFLYLIISLTIFHFAFKKSKNYGLARLEQYQ